MASLARPTRRLPSARIRGRRAAAPAANENLPPATFRLVQPATGGNGTNATTTATATGSNSVETGLRSRDANAGAGVDAASALGPVRFEGPRTPPPGTQVRFIAPEVHPEPTGPPLVYPRFPVTPRSSPKVSDLPGSFSKLMTPNTQSRLIDDHLNKLRSKTVSSALLSSPTGTLDPRRIRTDLNLGLPTGFGSPSAYSGWTPSPGASAKVDLLGKFPPLNDDTVEETLRPRKRRGDVCDSEAEESWRGKKARALETVEEGEDTEGSVTAVGCTLPVVDDEASCAEVGEDDVEESAEGVEEVNIPGEAADNAAGGEYEDSQEYEVRYDADDEAAADDTADTA